MSEQFTLPNQVEEVMAVLASHYYEAYLAGECVREMYTGGNPLDFDIITNAEPARIIAIFEPLYKINTDNEANGEIVVFCRNTAIGIASYRKGFSPDGRPIYTQIMLEELQRRDFTINAMAYSHASGLYDPFNAAACLSGEQKIIRAIGESAALLDEADPQRRNCVSSLVSHPINILKAVSLYASGEYVINEYTIGSMISYAPSLADVSPKEILPVLEQAILGRRIAHAMAELSEVFFSIIPELRFSYNFEQYSSYQEYTLWEHILRSVGYASPDPSIRFALLFHGLGKYDCYASRGTYASYSGHAERACIIAERIMTRLGFYAERISEVLFLIAHHDDDADFEMENMPLIIEKYGVYMTKKLLMTQAANIRAKSHSNELYAAKLRNIAGKTATFR